MCGEKAYQRKKEIFKENCISESPAEVSYQKEQTAQFALISRL